jgi:hypothetical protein
MPNDAATDNGGQIDLSGETMAVLLVSQEIGPGVAKAEILAK